MRAAVAALRGAALGSHDDSGELSSLHHGASKCGAKDPSRYTLFLL
jgi:hypothetical protein